MQPKKKVAAGLGFSKKVQVQYCDEAYQLHCCPASQSQRAHYKSLLAEHFIEARERGKQFEEDGKTKEEIESKRVARGATEIIIENKRNKKEIGKDEYTASLLCGLVKQIDIAGEDEEGALFWAEAEIALASGDSKTWRDMDRQERAELVAAHEGLFALAWAHGVMPEANASLRGK